MPKACGSRAGLPPRSFCTTNLWKKLSEIPGYSLAASYWLRTSSSPDEGVGPVFDLAPPHPKDRTSEDAAVEIQDAWHIVRRCP